MSEKLRYMIARIIDNLFPYSCWADLVAWAEGFISLHDVDFSGKCRFRSQGESPELDRCYCGKNIYEAKE